MAELLSAGYNEEMAPNRDASPVAQLAIEEIMRTDPNAAFEWPAGSTPPSRGVTYTPLTGDG